MGLETGDESWEVIPEDPSQLRSRIISLLARQGGFDEMVRNAHTDWIRGNLEEARRSYGQEVSKTPEWFHMNLLALVLNHAPEEEIVGAYTIWIDAEMRRADASGDPEKRLWLEVRLAFMYMAMDKPALARDTLATARDAAVWLPPSEPSLHDHICTIMEILGWEDAQPDQYG